MRGAHHILSSGFIADLACNQLMERPPKRISFLSRSNAGEDDQLEQQDMDVENDMNPYLPQNVDRIEEEDESSDPLGPDPNEEEFTRIQQARNRAKLQHHVTDWVTSAAEVADDPARAAMEWNEAEQQRYRPYY